ncbi:aminotransferase class I/II-fold pyridoxal phosphate-dependent enzyme [Amycolatopsis sp. NPDC003865]
MLDLHVAEMDVSACPPVFDAVGRAVREEAFGYPVPDTLTEVPWAAAKWLGELGLSVDASAIRIVPDVMRGIAVAIRRLTRPASAVLVPTPAYPRFFEVTSLAGRAYVEVPMLEGPDGLVLDLDAVERGLREGAGSVLLGNPVNPTGTVLGVDQLSALSEIVDRWGARVIADEVHAPIRYGVPFVPYGAVNDASRAHSVTVTSATKAWNFPGLRTAVVALTSPDDVEVWNGLRHAETSGTSPLGMVATAAALELGGPWLAAVLRALDSSRRMVGERLARAGLGEMYRMPDATYFAWLDLRSWDSSAPAARLLETAGVALGEGAHYGAAGAGFVRLNFATPPAQLSQALDRIIAAVRSGGRTRGSRP